MVTRVGYIGIGHMGTPMATNVAKGGFALMVYDIREEPLRELAQAGANLAQSAREVGAFAEVVELSVVDDAQVESVIAGPEGVLEGAKPGTVIAIHSTIHPKTVLKVAAAAGSKGVGVLDAQVSGGSVGAWERTLCYMVGGDRELFERCRPVFATSGKSIFHVGPLGAGAATKVAQQMIFCINRLSAYEGMRLAQRAGVDLEALKEVVHATGAQSAVVDAWRLDQRLQVGHSIEDARWLADNFWKGLLPALELGHELGIALPATALVQQLFPKVLGLED